MVEPELIAFVRPEINEQIQGLIGNGTVLSFVDSLDGLTQKLKEQRGVIVLIDREYSGLNVESLGTLRAIYPDTVKLVLTEHPELDMVMEFINSGAVFGFMQIPIEPSTYKTLIDRARVTVQSRLQHRALLEKVRQFDSDLGALLMKRLQALEEENRALKQQVIVDPLTGCFNVRFMRYQLSLEYDKFMRYGEGFSILMMDMDNFKSINDNYGHQVGDGALKTTARVLKASVRSSDLVIRYGGDEFMVIAPNTDMQGAIEMGRRIEKGMKAERRKRQGQKQALKVPASLLRMI
jgi:diguanylate cyclase (GGDEF)-like protein